LISRVLNCHSLGKGDPELINPISPLQEEKPGFPVKAGNDRNDKRYKKRIGNQKFFTH
jgi:hypothetical protein